MAPLAARSERLTRSSFCATCAGGSSGRKCTPSTIASVLRTYCSPGGPSISATSSLRPSAPGAASGAKKRAMRWNSSRCGAAVTVPPLEFVRPERARQVVEHAIDHARLLAFVEGVADVEIFADHHRRRHILARQQLI